MMIAVTYLRNTIMPRINYQQLLDIHNSMCSALDSLGLIPTIVTEVRVASERQAALDTDQPDATIRIIFEESCYTKDFQSLFNEFSDMSLPVNVLDCSAAHIWELNLAVETSHPICNPSKVQCAMWQFDYLVKCTQLEQKLLYKRVSLPNDYNEQWEGFRDQIKQATTEEALFIIFKQITNYYMQYRPDPVPCNHAPAQATTGHKNPTTWPELPLGTMQRFNIDTK